MRILSLPKVEEKQSFNASGVLEEQIDKNHRYSVSIFYLPEGTELRVEKNYFRTYYVLEGAVLVGMQTADKQGPDVRMFKEGKGWLLLPGQSQTLKAGTESKIFAITSAFPLNDIEITERAKKEALKNDVINELNDYTVNKPWGSEQWFVDTGVYVFKGIRMNSGFECSLQLHERKIEVNLLVSGKARLILEKSSQVEAAINKHYENGGNQVNFSMSSAEVDVIKNSFKPVVVSPGEGWKAKPYEIHQVLSLDTYFALEVSTPEVDDIIRLKDLYNRPGGRINSEHSQTSAPNTSL